MRTLLASKDSQADADFAIGRLKEQYADYQYEIRKDGTRFKLFVLSDKSTPEVVTAVESMRLIAQEQPTRNQRNKDNVVMGVTGSTDGQ